MQLYKPEPEDIYNIDKTGFAMGETGRTYVIINKLSNSKGYFGSSSKGESLTIIEYVSVAGLAIPLFVIFKGKHLQST